MAVVTSKVASQLKTVVSSTGLEEVAESLAPSSHRWTKGTTEETCSRTRRCDLSVRAPTKAPSRNCPGSARHASYRSVSVVLPQNLS